MSNAVAHPSGPTQRVVARLRAHPVWLGLGIALGLLLAAGAVPRIRARVELQRAADAAASAHPKVGVTKAHPAPPTDLTLPGTTLPYQQATIYARVDGYLDRRLVDIGDRVKAGDLLALISAPTIDQQVAQARADLVRLKADREYARTSLERFQAADRDGAVAKEDLDLRRNAFNTAEAAVQAGVANLQQLTELQGFERVTAPFDGIITQRSVDVGALITAGSSTSTTSLFAIAQTDVLRVYLNVPQPFVNDMAVGHSARITTRSVPGREFTATVTRSAGSLDPSTRTMLTEVDIPNPEDLLKPGMYVQVSITAERAGPRLRVPASAVVFDAKGTQVAIVSADHKVQLRPVVLGRDFGSEIEIASGIAVDETIVTTPSAALTDGTLVEPVETKQ